MESHLNYAGFWKRFSAYIIDYAVLVFVFLNFHWFYDQFLEMEQVVGKELKSLILQPFFLIIMWSYYSGMESSPLKATIGKLAVGIFVTDMVGERISFEKATGRFFGKIISTLIIYIGFIMAGFTEKKQALHDKMANCLVLSK